MQNMMEPIRTEVEITSNEILNHDCHLLRFKFLTEKIYFKIGEHLRIVKKLATFDHPEGQVLIRKYTPINPCCQTDIIELLIKIYRPNVHPEHPHGGKLTPYLQTLKPGDKLDVEGPYGKFHYQPGGNVVIDGQKHSFKRLFFMAGGSGITPIFQTIQEISKMKEQGIENIEMALIFANKAEEDIVLKKQLESMSKYISIHYILDNLPNENWKGYFGYLTKEILSSIYPLDDPSTLYIHCGPFPMNKFIRTLFSTEFPHSHLFKF